jgi:hypothetical protein
MSVMGQKMNFMYSEDKKIASTDDTEGILEENGVQFPLQNLADLDAFELKIIKNKPLLAQ